MTRAWFASLAAAGWLAAALPAAAAEIAVLKSTDAAAWRPAIDQLRANLQGHSVTEHDLGGDRAQGQRVVSSLKGQAAVLVAMGLLAAEVARETAPELPLVFSMVPDPDKAGLSNAPNAMGVAFNIPVKNQLAAFRMVNPRAVRIGVIHGPNARDEVTQAQQAAGVVRLVIVDKPVESERDVPEALRSLLSDADALWIPPDPILLGEQTRRFIMSETLKKSKPIYSFSSALVAEGALVSNGADMESIGRQAAELVTRFIAGERPSGGLRVPRAELVINKKIADKLKIEIPADALKAAAKVY